MGGQLRYFGLWLDCEYGQGHSMAKPLSTTYHSPTLSKQEQFQYTDVEVWKVSNIKEDIEEAEAKAEQRVSYIFTYYCFISRENFYRDTFLFLFSCYMYVTTTFCIIIKSHCP